MVSNVPNVPNVRTDERSFGRFPDSGPAMASGGGSTGVAQGLERFMGLSVRTESQNARIAYRLTARESVNLFGVLQARKIGRGAI